MIKRPRSPIHREGRRRWPSPSILLAGVAVFAALGGTAVAENSLIRAADLAPGAVTSKALRNGAVELRDLSAKAQASLKGNGGSAGATGAAGAAGSTGTPGANGANGPNGANGIDGIDGTDGTDGTNGTDGTDGIDGTIAPLSAKQGLTPLPTATPPTTVVSLAVPAGNYVVLAKTQLTHSGAGDSIDCTLKAGAATIDQGSMKTLPALAAIPVSLQAVTTVASPSQLSVECDVVTADGSANFSSLIAIPTG